MGNGISVFVFNFMFVFSGYLVSFIFRTQRLAARDDLDVSACGITRNSFLT